MSDFYKTADNTPFNRAVDSAIDQANRAALGDKIAIAEQAADFRDVFGDLDSETTAAALEEQNERLTLVRIDARIDSKKVELRGRMEHASIMGDEETYEDCIVTLAGMGDEDAIEMLRDIEESR